MDGIIRATDLINCWPKCRCIWVWRLWKRSVAERAYGMGAKVTVVEPDSVRALRSINAWV